MSCTLGWAPATEGVPSSATSFEPVVPYQVEQSESPFSQQMHGERDRQQGMRGTCGGVLRFVSRRAANII